MCKSSRSSGAGPRKFTPIWSRSRSPYIGSPLNVSYAEFFCFMLQFLCLQCACTVVVQFPRGGGGGSLGDRPPGGGGGPSSLGWGRTGGGGVPVCRVLPVCVCVCVCCSVCPLYTRVRVCTGVCKCGARMGACPGQGCQSGHASANGQYLCSCACRADVCDAATLQTLFRTHNFTHVVHLAAYAGVRYSEVSPKDYERSNVECTVTLLEVLRHLPSQPRVGMRRRFVARGRGPQTTGFRRRSNPKAPSGTSLCNLSLAWKLKQHPKSEKIRQISGSATLLPARKCLRKRTSSDLFQGVHAASYTRALSMCCDKHFTRHKRVSR